MRARRGMQVAVEGQKKRRKWCNYIINSRNNFKIKRIKESKESSQTPQKSKEKLV
jgi:single-stranded DNA-binding protein